MQNDINHQLPAILQLPSELIDLIGSYLPLGDLLQARASCSFFQSNLAYQLKKTILGQCVKQIAMGGCHTIVLLNNGTVWVSGCNEVGQLGLGHFNNCHEFTCIPLLNNVIKVVTGPNQTFFFLKDGRILACGDNSEGQLGFNPLGHCVTPTAIPCKEDFLINEIQEIISGGRHTFFQMKNGDYYACGLSHVGPPYNKILEPYRLPFTNIAQVAAGIFHSIFLLTNGTVLAWGSNYYGQLGLGNVINFSTLQPISNLKDVEKIFASYSQTVFIFKNGCIFVCGDNLFGQLALGHTDDCKTPTVVPGLTNVKNVILGESHTLFHLKDNRILGTGSNYFGQLNLQDRDKEINLPRRILESIKIKEIKAGLIVPLAYKKTDISSHWVETSMDNSV